MEFLRHRERQFRHLLSAPFIYSMIFPLVILDVFVELYHRVCFPLYGIPYIHRGKYIRIDRHRLQYLTLFERIHCAYCGYANGLLPYASAVAAATERYWCGIRHREGGEYAPPEHHKDFLPYGDVDALQAFAKDLPSGTMSAGSTPNMPPKRTRTKTPTF